MHRYTLVEIGRAGERLVEEFGAPSDQLAVERAIDAVFPAGLQLWRDNQLVADIPPEPQTRTIH